MLRFTEGSSFWTLPALPDYHNPAFFRSRVLRLLLAFALPVAAQAQFTYTTNNGAITLKAYTGSGGAVVIPDQVNGLPVTSIGVQALAQSPSLVTSVTIPDSVTNIARSAFPTCFNLTNVIMSTNVIAVGDYAFYAAHKLRSITFPNSLISLGASAFASCDSLTNAVLGESLTSIRDHAFDSCTNLLSISIPPGVTNIGIAAFFLCQHLTNFTIGSNVLTIASQAFEGCERLTSGLVPAAVNNIGDYAFYNCFSLTNLTLPDGLTNIGNYTFSYCTGLPNLVFPQGLVNVGGSAFLLCTNVTAFFFRGDAPTLGSGAFFADQKATVYYLPGTTGWGPTFGGLPTMLWLPQVETSGSGFGVKTNQFGFTLNWANGMSVVVEACTNIANPVWLPVATNVISGGSSYFVDPGWSKYPRQFYRLRSAF